MPRMTSISGDLGLVIQQKRKIASQQEGSRLLWRYIFRTYARNTSADFYHRDELASAGMII